MYSSIITVLAGGNSSEREVSLWTLRSIQESLRRTGVKYTVVDPAAPDWEKQLIEIKPDVVLIALHGGIGESGAIQEILQELNLSYTGSDPNACRLAWDKNSAKQSVFDLTIPTAKWELLDKHQVPSLDSPMVIKPNREGSSFGVTIVTNNVQLNTAIKKAAKYDPQVLVEEYLSGRELSCGVIDVFGSIQALPIIEIRPNSEYFDFRAKYDETSGCQEICPAEIDTSISNKIQTMSKQIFQKFGISQYCRIDWILVGDTPYFLEINTLPGMTKTSLINKELAAAGISFDNFIKALLDTAKYSKQKKIPS